MLEGRMLSPANAMHLPPKTHMARGREVALVLLRSRREAINASQEGLGALASPFGLFRLARRDIAQTAFDGIPVRESTRERGIEGAMGQNLPKRPSHRGLPR